MRRVRPSIVLCQTLLPRPPEAGLDLRMARQVGADALRQAEAQDGCLGKRRRPVHLVTVPGRQPTGRECPEVARQRSRVPGAPAGAVGGMGTGTEGEVRTAAPVEQVVPALVPGPGQVGDLVAAQPGRPGQLVGEQLHLRRALLGLPRAGAGSPTHVHRGDTGRWSPVGPVSPSASGSSSVSVYTERWSGARSSAASSVARHPSRLWPGTSVRRSRLTEGTPAARAASTAAPTSAARCRRPRRRSSPSSRDCAPMDSRVTPASRNPARSPSSSRPGFASMVTSASAARPSRSSMRPRSRSTWCGREQRGRATAQVDAAQRPHVTRPHVTRPHVTRPHVTRPHVTLPGVTRQQVGAQVQLADDGLEELGHAPPGPPGGSTRHDHEVAVGAVRDAEGDVHVEPLGRQARDRLGHCRGTAPLRRGGCHLGRGVARRPEVRQDGRVRSGHAGRRARAPRHGAAG